MSLILASSNEIVAGKPLPWPLYDLMHNLLLVQGDIVRDDKHRDALLANGACYELSWEAPDKEDGDDNFPAVEQASSKQSAENKAGKSYTFDDMSHAWVTYYPMSEEEFKQQLAERNAKVQANPSARARE